MIIFKCKCGREKRVPVEHMEYTPDGTVLAYVCLQCNQRGR